MAYADYKFYTESYFGNVVPKSDFPRMESKASDFVDILTHDRLVNGLPTDERAQTRIKKAVCSLADTLYQIELAEKQALSVAESGLTSSSSGAGKTTGVVTSVSSGSESISYATPQQIGAGAKEMSALYAAAGDPKEKNRNLEITARTLLTGIYTDEGIPILYAGV